MSRPKSHLKQKAARAGLIMLDQIRDRFKAIRDRVPVDREPEWQSCLEMIESLSDAILANEDLSDEVAMQRLEIPELFLLSLEQADEDQDNGQDEHADEGEDE
jgi:hypothetical protein